jgi:asparagine synthase (glutamine-hydrolysing)
MRARRLAGSLALDAPARYARYVAWWDAESRSELYTPDFARTVGRGGEAVIASAWTAGDAAHVVDRMLQTDAGTYLVDDLIAKVDIATMAHSLEARSPLLDHELMEFAAAIPAELKVRNRQKKWIFREALRGWLPDDILDRPKQGFSVPLSAWLRGDLRPWAAEILLDRGTLERGYFRPASIEALLARHDSGSERDAKRIWSLVMLELWHREFADPAAGGALADAA